MKPEAIRLSKISRSLKDKHGTVPLMRLLGYRIHRDRKQNGGWRGLEVWVGVSVNGCRVSTGDDEKSFEYR